MANRDVYSKEMVDLKVDAVKADVEYMQEDIRWLVRQQGGTPSVEATEDSNTP
jgi:hypothetical protein